MSSEPQPPTTQKSGPKILPADGSREDQLNIFRTMQRSPVLYRAFVELGKHLLGGGVVPARERELVILRVGFRARAEYEFAQHVPLGEQAGLSAAEITHVAGGEGSWEAGDAALVAMVDELSADDAVTDATWDLLAARWDSDQMMELLVLAGFYRLVSGMLNSVGVAIEPGTSGWPEGVDLRRAPRA